MNDGQYAEHDLVALLAPTLGRERAQELVRGALETLNIAGATFSAKDAVRILEVIGRNSGFVGSVSRFVLARFTLNEGPASSPRPRSSMSASRGTKDEAIGRNELAALLAPTLGQEKSDEVILEVLKELALPLETVSLSQGLAVLDRLALSEGLMGVASRFAKAHLLMRAPKS